MDKSEHLESNKTEEITSLIILQASPFCNIDCTYCYLPDRSNRVRLPLEKIEEIFERLFLFPTLQKQVTIVWHAGEPLTLGTKYYHEAFSRIARITPPELQIAHSFQTNGMLINDDWCDLIEQWGVGIGVSIDGPAHLHDAYRKTRSGRGTHAQCLSGINTLKRRNISFNAIAVLTPLALAQPQAMFEFLYENGIADIGFNVEEAEGAHPKSNLQAASYEEPVRNFFRVLSENMQKTGFDIHIRELEETTNSLLYLSDEGPMNNLTTPFGIITIDVEGNLYTFSPELVGFSNHEYQTFAIGNVLNQSFSEMIKSAALNKLKRDIDKGVDLCKSTCNYFRVCGGGAPSNKIFENGTFNSSETMHCRLTKKSITDFILDMTEKRF